MKGLKREVFLKNPVLLTMLHSLSLCLNRMRICIAYIGYCMIDKNMGNFIYYNVPLMMIIALMLALVETPTMTWTQMNMLLMLMNETSNPMEKG